MSILGLILAGGASSRMGRNKVEIELGGQRLIDRAIGKLAPQVDEILLSATQDFGTGCKFIADEIKGEGPLSGLMAGLSYAEQQGFASMVSVAVDTPFFPDDLVKHLQPGQFVARHYTCAHWPISCLKALKQAFQQGERRLFPVQKILGFNPIEMPEALFFNVNSPEDLIQAKAKL